MFVLKSKLFFLKILTNEKEVGLTAGLFDRSRFKHFTLKFSNIYILSSSCERPKTAQRTLFLLTENNIQFLNIAIALEVYAKVRVTIKSRSHIAINSLPTLQISLGIVEFFKKIFDEQPILTVLSNIGKDLPLFQMYAVKSESQPNITPLFENNY
jgi:hypothetical protein